MCCGKVLLKAGARGGAQAVQLLPVQPRQQLAERRRVLRCVKREEIAVLSIVNELRQGAARACKDGARVLQGLRRHEAEGLPARGHDHGVAGRVPAG